MKGFYNVFYVASIVFQAIFDLLFCIGVAILISWLLVSKLSAPTWIYAPFIIVGAVAGMISMIKFILRAMASLESIERSQKEVKKNERSKKK